MPETYSEKDLKAFLNNEVIGPRIGRLIFVAQTTMPENKKPIIRKFIHGLGDGTVLQWLNDTDSKSNTYSSSARGAVRVRLQNGMDSLDKLVTAMEKVAGIRKEGLTLAEREFCKQLVSVNDSRMSQEPPHISKMLEPEGKHENEAIHAVLHLNEALLQEALLSRSKQTQEQPPQKTKSGGGFSMGGSGM